MSEYLFINKSKSQSENLLSSIRENEFWQDESLFNNLEQAFSVSSSIDDLAKKEKERSENKYHIASLVERIDKYKDSHKKIEQNNKNANEVFEVLKEKNDIWTDKIKELNQEINNKQTQKLELENPINVSQIFINNVDSNGINLLFMHLYNKIQHQQFLLQAQSYNFYMNQMKSNIN